MAHGSVTELTRWPVKSLRGERVDAARFDQRGMAGDRAYALLDERETRAGNVLTVRQNPALLSWAASYGTTADPTEPPSLQAPDGADWSWTDPKLADVLADSLNIPLGLRAADGQQDRGPTVLVTFEASRAALCEELGADVDLHRFRTNVHVTTDQPAFVEEDWTPGTVLTAGEVELTVTGDNAGPCIRCAVPSWDAAGRKRWRDLQTHLIGRHDNKFGVIMRVTRPGTVHRGDAVSVH